MKGWGNGMHAAPNSEHQRAAVPSPEPARGIMNQEATRDDGLVVFSFRAWNSLEEPWDDFMSALQQGYSQYLDRSRRKIMADQRRSDPRPEGPDQVG